MYMAELHPGTYKINSHSETSGQEQDIQDTFDSLLNGSGYGAYVAFAPSQDSTRSFIQNKNRASAVLLHSNGKQILSSYNAGCIRALYLRAIKGISVKNRNRLAYIVSTIFIIDLNHQFGVDEDSHRKDAMAINIETVGFAARFNIYLN